MSLSAHDDDDLSDVIELLATIINHDLRNPLSAITTAAHLIGSRTDSERITRPLGRIVASAERIDRMVSQLVDVARIRAGSGLRLDPEPLDLAVVAHALVGDMPEADRARIEVTARGDCAGVWDRARLPALLGHLLDNACEHGDAGRTVSVAVDGDDPDQVRVEIHNCGAIVPERLALIFGLPDAGIRRRHRRESRGHTGLGLGLYLSNEIALAHGGVLSVTSDDDDGTRFTLALPRHAATADPP